LAVKQSGNKQPSAANSQQPTANTRQPTANDSSSSGSQVQTVAGGSNYRNTICV
ncbi:unnamed protein product, partial [Ceratitis capitata]